MADISGTYGFRGPGGRFSPTQGSIGFGDDLSINVNIGTSYDPSGIQAASADIKSYTTIVQQGIGPQNEMGRSGKETAEEIRQQIAPIRSVSWDLLLMGRSMSILNTTFFGSSQIIKDVTGAIYALGAVMRIFVTLADIERVLLDRGIIQHAVLSGILIGKAKAYDAVAAAAGRAAVAEGASMAVGALGGGGLGFAGMMSTIGILGILQKGGTVSATGPYVLHKGETVIPAGGSMNIININMTTGGISSSVDVDNMLDAMALRMAQESRRRLGRT